MAEDIVDRLQEMLDGPVPMTVTRADARDALAEIERLRAAGDALAEALSAWIDGMDAFEIDQDRLRAWRELRRG